MRCIAGLQISQGDGGLRNMRTLSTLHIAVILVVWLCSTATGQQASLTINHVVGGLPNDVIKADTSVQFHMRITATGQPNCALNPSIGLQVYSDDGAQWGPVLWQNLPALIDRTVLDGAVAAVNERMDQLTDGDKLMELLRIVSLPGDAHTFPFVVVPSYDLHSLPLQVFGFSDGWGIVAAGRECRRRFQTLEGGKAALR